MWENAPQLAKWMKKNKGGDRWLGRRINDEIELFDKGDEEVSSLFSSFMMTVE